MPIKRSGPTHLTRKYVDVVRRKLYVSTYISSSSHRLTLNEYKKESCIERSEAKSGSPHGVHASFPPT